MARWEWSGENNTCIANENQEQKFPNSFCSLGIKLVDQVVQKQIYQFYYSKAGMPKRSHH